jgi:hypothetical protein
MNPKLKTQSNQTLNYPTDDFFTLNNIFEHNFDVVYLPEVQDRLRNQVLLSWCIPLKVVP